jgi:amidase
MSRTEGIDATLKTHRLDAIVAFTNGPAWLTDLVNGDRFTGGSSTPAAVAGYPSITVPMGDIHGLPIGLSFIGSAWSEGKLIKLAYSLEQAIKARKQPKFHQTIDV